MDLQAEAGRKYMEVIAGCLRVPVAPNSTVLRGKGNTNRLRLVCMRLSSETFLISGGATTKNFHCCGARPPATQAASGHATKCFSLRRNIVSQEQGIHDFETPALSTKPLSAAMAAGAVDAAARLTYSG